MPFIHEIVNSDGSFTAVWSVNETIDDLVLLCKHRGIDTDPLRGTKATARRSEQLVERLLLHKVFGRPMELLHTPDGAPVVAHSSRYVSISHTPGLVVLAHCHNHPVGIDVERLGPRVLRVRERFLNKRELAFIDADDIVGNLIAWTAKEAIFKVAGQPEATMTQMTLDPFKSQNAGVVHFTAHYSGRTFGIATTIREDVVLSVATEHGNNDEQQPISPN